MASLFASIKKQTSFISDNLWRVRLSKLDPKQAMWIRQVRIFALAFKGFNKDNCVVSAAALTFYTLFSIVPILALVFAIAKGFGFEKGIQEQLLQNYTIRSNPSYIDLLNNAFGYANSMLASAKGGVIAGFGVVLLLWSVMNLLISVENSFNEIWKVPRGRSWVRKITDYLTIMLVGPIFLFLSGGVTVAIETRIDGLPFLGPIAEVFARIFAGLLPSCLFAFLYITLPNTKINFRSAAAAAILSTLLFELLAWAYVRFQIGANRMNAIYGGFAALPLFLIWVQYNWYIVLFGAELAYASQHVDHYELEEDIQNLSQRYRKVIALMVANLVARRFYNNEPAIGYMEISKQLDLPSPLTQSIVKEFVETGILAEVTTDKPGEIVYHPGVTESRFTVKYVVDAIERNGVNSLPINDTKELIHINEIMRGMDEALDTRLGNVNVKDLVL